MTRLVTTCAALLATAVAAGSGLAQDAPSQPRQAPAAAPQSCSSGGVQYAVGEYACLPACHGERRLAQCEINVTTKQPLWTYVSDACPSAVIINPRWPSDWSETPVATDMTPLPVNVKMSAISPAIAPKIGSHWPALIR
jgi:hypothetical protein